ncbi:hypothetical protein HLB03_11680 [Acidianus sp. DSM 29099]|nr:hypothetical protein [Acidianus sp. RZ1]
MGMTSKIFWKLSLIRFASLTFPVPTEIMILFKLSDAKSFLLYFGISMITSLLILFAMQQNISWSIDFRDKRRIQFFNQLCYCIILVISSFIYVNYCTKLDILLTIFITTEVYYGISFQVYSAIAQGMIETKMAGKYNGFSEIFGQVPTLFGSLITASIWSILSISEIILLTAVIGFIILPSIISLPSAKTTIEHHNSIKNETNIIKFLRHNW